MNVDLQFKKKSWKDQYIARNEEYINYVSKIEAEKEKRYKTEEFYKTMSTQTELDELLMKKYHAAYDIHSDNQRNVN